MPTFGYAQNWGIPTAPTRPSGGQTLIRSSTPERSNDLSWAAALPAALNVAVLIPRLFGGSSNSAEARPAATRAIASALQAVAARQGHGLAGSFIPAVASLVAGDTRGAVRSGTGAATAALAGAAGVPGWGIGPLATLASGIISGDDKQEMQDALINSGTGSLFSALGGPAGTLGYQLLRMLGFNPAQGVNKLLSDKNYEEEGGDPGKLGGWFGKVDDYNGYTPGQAYYPGTNELHQNLRLAALDEATRAGATYQNSTPAEQAAEAAALRAANLRYYTPPSAPERPEVQEAVVARYADDYRPGESFSNGWSSSGGYSSDGSRTDSSGMAGGTGGAFAQGGSVKNAWGF